MISSDPTAVMGHRIGAYLIDAGIGFIVMVVAFITILDKVTMPSSQEASNLCDLVNNSPGSNICIAAGSTVYGGTSSDITEISLVMLAFFVVFHIVLPTLTGYSPGKGMLGLRVVKQDTFQHAGIGANAVRGLLWAVDAAPFIIPLVGLITGLASKGHRRVGDMAASTFVVMKESVGSPTQVAGFAPMAAAGGAAAPPPPSNWAPPMPTSPPVSAPVSAPVAAPASPPVSAPVAAPASPPVSAPPVSTPPVDTPATEADPQPGVDAPQWDTARNTYIQWDAKIEQWMEWGEAQGKWIPISQ